MNLNQVFYHFKYNEIIRTHTKILETKILVVLDAQQIFN